MGKCSSCESAEADVSTSVDELCSFCAVNQDLSRFLRSGRFGQPVTEAISDASLGHKVREYLMESMHNGWDGHEEADRPAYARLLSDLLFYITDSAD